MSISPRLPALTVLALLLGAGLPAQAQGNLQAPSSKPGAHVQVHSNTIEIVFAIDTTGSMGGLIEGAKTKVWSIVNDVMQRAGKGTVVRVGLVAYRDRQDAYVTEVTPLTDNLDEVYNKLMTFRAQGGGDTPEDVRMALRDALEKTGWAKAGPNLSQILFLVGDAPPHDDYDDVPDTADTAERARKRGIIVNTIQCGTLAQTTPVWQRIAQYGGGEFFAIAQSGGVRAISTPYDAELSRLGTQMGGTYLAYGSKSVRESKKMVQSSTETRVAAAAPAPAQADRAVNKAINTRAYDESDLLQQVESGRLKMDEVKEEELPDDLRALPADKRQTALESKLAERKALRAKILELSKQRDAYIAEQRKKDGSPEQAFDTAVSKALAKQIK